ncbi:hypothetical protein ES332_D01G009400v1 [Gossypium tomentosum]|uniref:UNC-50 family protein n=2 Tax=Gossypium tomentosum TaxID=34277 RepID=A0A5D2M423_GOSTO|nr:hypothetical protein ES332_D01G009400v1 [Gossypium tomentosum]
MSARLAYWSSFLRFRLLIFKSNSKSNSYKNSSNMSPTVSKTRSSISISRPNAMFPQYLRRIVKWQQMDIEYTFWQMLHLCTAPKIAYQHTKYHKQTKNQWARDDPAFVVICSLLLALATVAYCAAYDHSAAHAVSVVISVLLFHFLLAGILLATCCWFLTNAYLREEAPNTCVVEQRVEWLYAFDVHCNSFFPMFVMLYVIHYFLSPLLVAHGFIPALLSNLLFMVAASYHHYLNFLVLPFLERTTFFLYPIGIVIILSPILILSGFNPSRYFMNIYFSRTL